MKTLAWILTAAAVLVGADVFVMSSDPNASTTVEASAKDAPVPLQGTSGIPTPPPDAHE